MRGRVEKHEHETHAMYMLEARGLGMFEVDVRGRHVGGPSLFEGFASMFEVMGSMLEVFVSQSL